MKPLNRLGLWAVCFSLCPMVAIADSEDQVRKTITGQVYAWNHGDIEAFCAIYSRDALFLSPTGVTRGREAVKKRYIEKYGAKGSDTMGTLSIEPIEFRRYQNLKKEAAVTVAAKWSLVWKDKKAASGLTLIVFERKGKSWQIVQDASM